MVSRVQESLSKTAQDKTKTKDKNGQFLLVEKHNTAK